MRIFAISALFYVLAVLFAAAQVGPIPGFGPTPTTLPIKAPILVGKTSSNPFSASSFTLTTTAAIPSLSLVAICIGINTANSTTVSSVSDGTNTYVKAISVSQNTGIGQTSLWYFLNAIAVGSSATITVNLAGASGAGSQYGIIAAASNTGMTNILDKTGSNAVASGNPSASSGTLTHAKEILFGCDYQNNANTPTYSGASGWTNVGTNIISSGAWAQDYKIVSATTTVTYVPVWSTTVDAQGAVLGSFY